MLRGFFKLLLFARVHYLELLAHVLGGKLSEAFELDERNWFYCFHQVLELHTLELLEGFLVFLQFIQRNPVRYRMRWNAVHEAAGGDRVHEFGGKDGNALLERKLFRSLRADEKNFPAHARFHVLRARVDENVRDAEYGFGPQGGRDYESFLPIRREFRFQSDKLAQFDGLRIAVFYVVFPDRVFFLRVEQNGVRALGG